MFHILQSVVDVTGRVEPGTITVIRSSRTAFIRPAEDLLAGSEFTLARWRGRTPVRAFVRLPIAFLLEGC
ncbi:MAG: hypothetical protein ACE5HT_11915 [Gemmatimonadales bacterium]